MHDSAQALRGKKLLLVGFTLFSMFFGAGNLIFPPYPRRAKAGEGLWPAFLGFAVSAVGLPIAGVIAVARADGLDELAGRVHPRFAQVFTDIGLPVHRAVSGYSAHRKHLVCHADPAAGQHTGLQLGYSVLFFGAAFLVALQPGQAHPLAGQAALPLPAGSDFDPVRRLFAAPARRRTYGTPTEAYSSAVLLQGVLYGYQTMDALAALNFGAVIAMNIRAQGVPGSRTCSAVPSVPVLWRRAAAGGLCHAGARRRTGAAVPGLATGAEVLTVLAERLFGKGGWCFLRPSL